MVKPITHKHGSSFVAEFTATANGSPLDLAPLTITSQFRSRDDDKLMPGVVVTKLVPAAGTFKVEAADTSAWVSDTELLWDIVIQDAQGKKSSSQTVTVIMGRRVTR